MSVTGNPDLLLNARKIFVKQYGLNYFAELITYIKALDKALYKIYDKKIRVNKYERVIHTKLLVSEFCNMQRTPQFGDKDTIFF